MPDKEETKEYELPANCGECERFIRFDDWVVDGKKYDGGCDEWAGVPLMASYRCEPCIGRKRRDLKK